MTRDPASTNSRQVDWYSVHQYAQKLTHGYDIPEAGTAAWKRLADDNPLKALALIAAAPHWALRIETCQQGLSIQDGRNE